MPEAKDERDSDEWEWVLGAQRGDRRCFEQLYRRHCGSIYALCLRLGRRSHEAEEMTQETFVRAWQHLDTFREPGHFGAWLNRVAVNLTLSARRRRSRRGEPLPLFEEFVPTGETASGAGGESRVDLDRAIACLPDGARTVFVLHDVHGYRHHEIATMTGIAIGTAKAQLHRARKRLRELLDK
ncbi:MAG TPA: RNA polymerase sigma factor [Candidatus Polarisedimenticolaceae bacterium]|nr:RNA polymerase sigma factor [Candidatus Polarisedimenticolaceae bacterium]